jgi:ubiquitin carboxyl-terminal hydrolase 14
VHPAAMKVNVKWGKEMYKDVEVNLNELPELFKMQLFSLTGVPIERQKVMAKGGMLQNDEWGKVTMKEGMTVMMMGSAEEPKKAPVEDEVKFIEDLPEAVSTSL